MHRKMVICHLISGGHIRPGPDMAGYEILAGFRPGPEPDMISGATLIFNLWHLGARAQMSQIKNGGLDQYGVV